MIVDIRQILEASRLKLEQLRSFFDLDGKEAEIARLRRRWRTRGSGTVRPKHAPGSSC